MWIRKRLDIGWLDLAAGLLNCCRPLRQAEWQSAVERTWGPQSLACLSVRSGLDLLLASLRWPAGGEVLVTALTIPDVPRIIQRHGLLPVPVDLDAATLGPDLPCLRRALTPATRGLVVAHLMGGRCDLEPVLQFARAHDLFVIEDCAQAYDAGEYRGHPAADASLFSFGTIKTATALGGACLRIRDPQLLDELRARQAAYPVQRRTVYFRRLLKYAVLKGLSGPRAFGLLVGLARQCGCDYDRAFNGLVRGFDGDDFFAQIRRQPSAPLLALLARRLNAYDATRIQRRTALGRDLADRLGDRYELPGAALRPHTQWVFPVLTDDPPSTIAALRESGFDATQGRSLCVVPPPAERPALAARAAERLLAGIVYVPIYPELPTEAVHALADSLRTLADRSAAGDGSPALPSSRLSPGAARRQPVGSRLR